MIADSVDNTAIGTYGLKVQIDLKENGSFSHDFLVNILPDCTNPTILREVSP